MKRIMFGFLTLITLVSHVDAKVVIMPGGITSIVEDEILKPYFESKNIEVYFAESDLRLQAERILEDGDLLVSIGFDAHKKKCTSYVSVSRISDIQYKKVSPKYYRFTVFPRIETIFEETVTVRLRRKQRRLTFPWKTRRYKEDDGTYITKREASAHDMFTVAHLQCSSGTLRLLDEAGI